jgi:hypothetical protein
MPDRMATWRLVQEVIGHVAIDQTLAICHNAEA